MRQGWMLATISVLALTTATRGEALVQATVPQDGIPAAPGQPAVPDSETPVPQAAIPPAEGSFPQGADSAGVDPASSADGASADAQTDDIVVTGVRSSLERAAEIKRDAIQVVDSIVAQDIGKFPDPTTAAALQRVPGVQVQNNNNNELGGVRIRGLTDILTTIDGREVFSTTERSFNLQDLPAVALARVDVYKSQTADLIEGGVAGAIDLKLNKPFNFRGPTAVLSARNNYATRVGESNPEFGVLVTDRWNTGIGEIGALLNVTYTDNNVLRSQSNLTDRRSSSATPLSTSPIDPALGRIGYLIPEVIQNQSDVGSVTRKQVNAALQWQVTPSVQAYVDGLFTRTRNTVGFTGFNAQPYTTAVGLANVVRTDDCFQARVATGATATIPTGTPGRNITVPAGTPGQNPNIVTVVNPVTGATSQVLQPYRLETVCNIASATFNNIVINQNSNSQLFLTKNQLIAGGLRFDRERARASLDVAYQESRTTNENINTTSGQRVSSVQLLTDVDDGFELTVPAQNVLSGAALSIRNQLNQNYVDNNGSLFQAKVDGEYEVDSLVSRINVGLRYAKREATLLEVRQSTANPFGNVGTATENRVRLISTLPLGPNFLTPVAYAPRLNGGTDYLGINPAFLRSESGRNQLRAVFGVPLSRPAYDPTRQFDTEEETYASYAQAGYEVPIGTGVTLDGVLGVRATRTERTIASFQAQTVGATTTIVPVTSRTIDTDILPNATARLRLPGGFQTRFSYSKAIRRPDFSSLNPSLALTVQNNPFLLSSGSQGNPDLQPQKSDSFDATAEFYGKSGFVAVTGYYRKLENRVITASTQETINGLGFLVSRPRNVGKADLKGVEVSGQYFFDFLPGALAGFGALGAFTYADTEVKGDDPLAGYPLQGVSKYNYTAGLLYDKFGVSGRVVYTYRSSYFNNDQTGGTSVRPLDPDRPSTDVYLPTLLNYVRPAGRLDFSLGYDITDAFRIDVGGTNILRNQTKTYFGESFLNNSVFGDETTYTVGVRVRY